MSSKPVNDQDADSRLAVQSLLFHALEFGKAIVMVTDSTGRVEYVNAGFEAVTGFAAAEILGQRPNVLKSGLQSKDFYRRLWATISTGEAFTDVLINRKKDGGVYYEQKTITPVGSTDQDRKYVSIGRDITDQMLEQRRLNRFVSYDPVTDLPNRSLFMERLAQALQRCDEQGNELALVYFNVCRFRLINESLGYEAGDRVLRLVAHRLRQRFPQLSSLARLSGDDFVFFLEAEEAARTEDYLQAILSLFREPVECCGEELYITLALGVSLYPDDGQADVLMKNAEMAMDRSRATGSGHYVFYTAGLGADRRQKLSLEAELRRAVERQEFELHYQPQVALKTQRVVAVEALIRWAHPEQGLVYPGRFVNLLEETGLIVPVGEWVIGQACRDYRAISEASDGCRRIAINLSALQFRDASLPLIIERLLAEHGLTADCLEFEITESVTMGDAERVRQMLLTLADMGLRLSIDDFGTGYSSMSYLKRLPVHALKLALPFVQGLPDDQEDAGISRAVIGLAHQLGLEVVAEGVETESQLKFLLDEHCDLIQGFLYSRGLPLGALLELLKSGKSL